MRRAVGFVAAVTLASALAHAEPPDVAERLRIAEADEAAHRAGHAIEVRSALVVALAGDPARGARNLYQLGTDQRAIGEFDAAATSLERAAATDPRSDTAKSAITDALALRLALGQPAKAGEDADRVLERWGATDPELAAKAAFARGAWASDHDEPAGAERELAKAMATIDRGPTWLRLVAHATLAKALARHASDGKAAAEYARVRALGAQLAPPKGDDELRPYAKGLAAIGDATLFAADAQRDAARFTPAPAYAGAPSAADIDRWLAETVAPWVKARTAAVEALEPAYRAVLALAPLPPPGAVVTAGARVAALWSDAADALAAAAHPKVWDGPGASAAANRKLFSDRLALASASLVAKAKAANQWCVGASVKYQSSNAESAACGAWLSRRLPRDYPALDELAIAPAFRSDRSSVLAPLPRP